MAEAAVVEVGEVQKTSAIKKIMVPIAIGLVMTGIALGALHFLGLISIGGEAQSQTGDAAVEEAAEDDEMASPDTAGSAAFFFSFYPDMLVNFTSDGRAHYLKVSIDVMSRDEDAIKGVEEYHSIMRNNILKLFQQVQYETVKGTEGMESMQEIALQEVKRVLKQYHGNNNVEGVYFTSFVVQ